MQTCARNLFVCEPATVFVHSVILNHIFPQDKGEKKTIKKRVGINDEGGHSDTS